MPHVEQRRGLILESVHPFSAVAARGGQIVGAIGPDWITTMRSAAKPFQLAVNLELIADETLDDEAVALGSASHSAEPVHVAHVRRILSRYGLDETLLRCAAHPPVHVNSAQAVLRAGGHYGDIHNNCSGKHTFMLAACQRHGWAMDYRPPTHPLQQRIRAQVEAWAGERASLATDGCGVPTFGLSLAAMARAWAVMAQAMSSAAPSPLGRVGRVMADLPHLVSGTGRLEPALLAIAREPVAAKIGAEGLFCMAFPARDMGVVVKVHSGHSEALGVALLHALDVLVPGAIASVARWPWHEVLNVAGLVVGERAVVADLPA